MFYAFSIRKLKKFIVASVIFVLLCYMAYQAFFWLFPVEHTSIISRYSKEYGLREELVYGVIYTESRFNEKAVSRKGASGLMQLMKPTADWGAEIIGIENYDYSRVFEPEINIRIGCWYLARLIAQYGSEEVALAAYNAGSGNVSGWLADERYSIDGKTLQNIPFGETERYIEKVRINSEIYRWILNFLNIKSSLFS